MVLQSSYERKSPNQFILATSGMQEKNLPEPKQGMQKANPAFVVATKCQSLWISKRLFCTRKLRHEDVCSTNSSFFHKSHLVPKQNISIASLWRNISAEVLFCKSHFVARHCSSVKTVERFLGVTMEHSAAALTLLNLVSVAMLDETHQSF